MSCVAYLSRFSREITKIVVRNTGSDCPVEFGEVLFKLLLSIALS